MDTFELDPSKSQVIPALCRKAIEQKQRTKGGDQKNKKRAFVHVDDIVDGFLKAIKNFKFNGVIQLGPDCSLLYQKLQKIVLLTGKKSILNLITQNLREI